jgi:AraC-like DNA-binding protein
MSDLPNPINLGGLLRERTMIAFEASQEGVRDNGAHTHAAGQLLGSTRGLLSVRVERADWVVPATHCVWIPPNLVHAVRSHGPASGWSAFVSEEACVLLPAEAKTVRTTALLREAVHRLATLAPEHFSERHARLAGVIIDELDASPTEALGLPKPRDARLVRIADAILAEPADDRSLVDWSTWAGIAPRTMSRRFVIETGFSFSAWRQRARLLRALELLAQGHAVTSVSLDLGYENVSAFIALFRRTYGVTPREHRRIAVSGCDG